MAFGVIYKITCLVNGKPYIGQTKQTLNRRIGQHATADSYIGKAIRKYGWENFTVEVLEECETPEQLNERERFWIACFNCKHPNGYNLTDGGDGSLGCTQETRDKMSAAQRGEKNHFFGKHHTVETRAKLKMANSGKKILTSANTVQLQREKKLELEIMAKNVQLKFERNCRC